MTDEMCVIRVAEPLKAGGRWLRPGQPVQVTAEIAAGLAQRGLLAAKAADDEPEAATADQEREIAIKAQVIAEAIVEAAVSTALEDLTAARDAAEDGVARLSARVEDLTGELDACQADLAEARAALAAIGAAEETNAPPPKVAKTAPGKGAAKTPG